MQENNKDEIIENKTDETASEEVKKPSFISRIFSTIWLWMKRAFFGAGNLLYKEVKEKEKNKQDVFAVEKIESPGKQRVKAFLQKKLAVGALIVFLCIFVTMLIGPIFILLILPIRRKRRKTFLPDLI